MPIATPDIPLATIKRRAATPCWCRIHGHAFSLGLRFETAIMRREFDLWHPTFEMVYFQSRIVNIK